MSDSPYIELPRIRAVDGQPVRDTDASLIDFDRVAKHIAQARGLGRYDGPTDPTDYLLARRCVGRVEGQLCATLAGILCFGHDPQALLPHAVVDLGHYRGVEQRSFEVVHLAKNITGTLFDQLERIETYLWSNSHHGMTVTDGSFRRVDVHEYPQIVIRELCANMLAHRDYYRAESASRVMLFRNRIEWVSPGGLPPNVTVENILSAQVARNPQVLKIFYEAGYVEAFGQGLDTVVSVLKEETMEAPMFVDTGESFIVTVFGRSSDELLGSAGGGLNENQRRILAFIQRKVEATPKELRDLCGDRARRSLNRDIAGLINADLIEAVGSTRAQRYRIRGGGGA